MLQTKSDKKAEHHHRENNHPSSDSPENSNSLFIHKRNEED